MNRNKNMDVPAGSDWEAPFLASLPVSTPYRVPDGYFDQLTEHINQSVFLAGLSVQDKRGFTVPDDYFNELGMQIRRRISMESLVDRKENNGFQVPSGYFNELQSNIVAKTSARTSPAKILKLWQSEAMKYVSAACFIVLVASGLYLNQQHNVKQIAKAELANEQLLYDIDESVIFEHLEESQSANTGAAAQAEMENYILDHFSSSDLSNNL